MRGKAKIKSLESIVISDPHYESDVWCRFDKKFDKVEDWEVQFIIQDYVDELKINDKLINSCGVEYSILLKRPDVKCKLLDIDMIISMKDLESKNYEIGVDSAQVAFGINDKAQEINEYSEEFNKSDVAEMLSNYNPPFAIQTRSDGRYGVVQEAIKDNETQFIFINGYFDEDTDIQNIEQLKRYFKTQFKLEDVELEIEKIKVLYKEVGKKPKVIEIEDTLEAKQKLVGGLIQRSAYIGNMEIIYNEDHDLLPSNLKFDNLTIGGNCFVVAGEDKNNKFKSLNATEINVARKDLNRRIVEYENKKDLTFELEE